MAPARKAVNLTAICERTVYKMLGPPRPVTETALPGFTFKCSCSLEPYELVKVYKRSAESSVNFDQNTWRHIPKDGYSYYHDSPPPSLLESTDKSIIIPRA
jgi:hypothetical protein